MTASPAANPTFTDEGSAFLKLHAPQPGDPFDVIVIGAGQAGLSVGHHLAKRGLRFLILDADAHIGDQWRRRWDSLRLFTPARFDGLDGMPFPAPPDYFPTKDEMADYLQAYAERFSLPVRSGVRVQKLSSEQGRYALQTNVGRFEADQVVIAMANYQRPKVPQFARDFAPQVVQLHSSQYQRPAQLVPGNVLIVGGGNSGAEIARELAPRHPVWMAGRHVGEVPFRIDGFWGRLLLTRLVLRFLFHRLLTIRTPMGRKMRYQVQHHGGPLIRTKLAHLQALGVQRVARVCGVHGDRVSLQDGQQLRVDNVIWCTGFDAGLSWIELPIFDEHGEPQHTAGVVSQAPGVYFVGLHFLYSLSSPMIHGVGRDARRIAEAVARKARGARTDLMPS